MAVGDAVVYAAHGIGRVIAHERTRVAGTERDCIVVELATGLRVTLPIEEATERLRPVAGKAEIEDIRCTLASQPSSRDGSWTRRLTDNKAKLASGAFRDVSSGQRKSRIWKRATRYPGGCMDSTGREN